MSTALNFVDDRAIPELEKKEIESQIEGVISKHRNNRYEINKLVFESVSALTASQNDSDELASKGIIKRFWGGITGKNRLLQNKVDNNLAAAQYASQQTLQKLAEQNLMSFELITAVNNKLNESIIEIETEINNIYGTLVTFFKQTKSNIVQLENRLARLERNVNLLNWQNSIEYQMWNGIEYADLDDVSKIVCIIKDFYAITQGEWTTSDLLLLKTAITTIGLNCNELVNVRAVLVAICDNYVNFECIIPSELQSVEAELEDMLMMSYVQKEQKLLSSEKYMLDCCADNLNGDKNKIKYQLIDKYFKNEIGVSFDCNIKLYDFIVEMLYNIDMLKEKKISENYTNKLNKAEMLFWEYRFDEASEILREIKDYCGNRARFLLALIYERGCFHVKSDFEKAKELFQINIDNGDALTETYIMFKPYYKEIGLKDIYLNKSWCFDAAGLREKLAGLKNDYENGDELVDYIYAKLNIMLVRFSAKYYDNENDNIRIEPFMDKLEELGDKGNKIAKFEYAEQLYISGDFDAAFPEFQSLENANIGRVYYYLGEYCAWGYGDHIKYGQNSDETKMYRYMGKNAGDRMAELNIAFVLNDQEKRNKIFEEVWSHIRDLARNLDPVALYEYGDLVKYGYAVTQDREYAKWLYQLGAQAGVWKCRKKLEDF